MSQFSEELAIVPKAAVGVAATLFVVAVSLLIFLAVEGRAFLLPMLLFSTILCLVLSIYVLLVGYVYADARRRGMRYVLWTLLAIFIPNAIGIVLYFVLRDPMPSYCHACRGPIQPAFAFCPRCGAAAKPACAACRRAVEADWTNCAFCGAKL